MPFRCPRLLPVWPAPGRWLRAGTLAALLTSCAGRDQYFQPDARVGPAPGGSPDSALVTVGRHYAAHGRVFRAVFGAHYRTLWATPVVLPVLRLATLPGAPRPTALGGGFQTTSITLTSAAGRAWVARTLDKDPYRTLPKFLQHTFVVRLVRDETSAANPFAPLALPLLSRAAGVPYATPRLYYIAANDSAFDALTPKLRGKVVLVEEKWSGPEAVRVIQSQLPRTDDFDESEAVLRRRFTSPNHYLDQLAFARARLFDLWIGDWDRHQGQWTWADTKTDAPSDVVRHRYQPVPKDRDQAFFRFDDGALTWLASRRWAVRKLQTFGPRYDDVTGLALNARFLDERALAAVTAAQFDSLARDLQRRLPDSLITRAVARWPAPIAAQEAARTAADLRARRDALPDAARAFYQTLARRPLVVGTDEPERFTIDQDSDGSATVTITPTEPQNAPPSYRRTFRATETRRLTLHGLGGDDVFELTGTAGRGAIPVVLFGGEGADAVRLLPGAAPRAVTARDTKRGITLPDPRPAGMHRKLAGRGEVRVHAFDREGL